MDAERDGAGAAGPGPVIISRDAGLAVCCSGGGIRSATFNLGAIQAIQAAPAFGGVTTITAVSGGAYLAAAHALVTSRPDEVPGAAGQRAGPGLPYSLRSPEELHLRDHTRYLLETWQVAVRAVGTLIRGATVNALLAGSVIFVLGRLAGWLVGPGGLGILAGPRTAAPTVTLRWWWLIPAAGAVLTVGLAWQQALPHDAARPGAWRWLRGPRLIRHAPRWPLGARPARWSNRVLVLSLAALFVLVVAPLALQGLLTVSLGNGTWSVITRFLGFASAQACHDAAASAAAGHQVCGAAATAPVAVSQNAHASSTWEARIVSFGSVIAAVVTLARAALGKLRTFQADLSKSGLPATIAAAVGRFLRQRLIPWTGSVLIVVIIATLTLRWIASGASRSLVTGGAASQLAECGYAVVLFLMVKLATDINTTSMHAFYRDRLAAAYAVVRDGSQPGGVRDDPGAKLSDLGPGVPELVICAAANCTVDKDLPAGRGAVSFTFTPGYVGLSRHSNETEPAVPGRDRAPTTDYEAATGLRLFDAVAVSAAAVSPVMGKLTRPSLRILLAAANVRLGVWLPSPWTVPTAAAATEREEARAAALRRPPAAGSAELGGPAEPGEAPEPGEPGELAGPAVRSAGAGSAGPAAPPAGAGPWLRQAGAGIARRWRQPDLRHLWAEAAGSLHLDGRWLYVTDGGHYDNLGLVEALRRRAAHLIVIDASGDAPGTFTTLGQAISLARSEVGADVRIDPGGLGAGPGSAQCPDAFAHGTFSYAEETDPVPHHLFYLKLAVPAGAPWDVLAYQERHPSFPTDSTLQQLYDDQEFEAYRELGFYCASVAMSSISYQEDLEQQEDLARQDIARHEDMAAGGGPDRPARTADPADAAGPALS
jgi:hypothetical protein